MNDDEKIFETINARYLVQFHCRPCVATYISYLRDKQLLADKKNKTVYFTYKLLSNTTLSTLNFSVPTLVKIRKPCGDVLPSRVSISSVGCSPAKKERGGGGGVVPIEKIGGSLIFLL